MWEFFFFKYKYPLSYMGIFKLSLFYSVLESDISKLLSFACPSLKLLCFLGYLYKPQIAFWMSHRSPKLDRSKNLALDLLLQTWSFPCILYVYEGNLYSSWIQAEPSDLPTPFPLLSCHIIESSNPLNSTS